MSEEQVDFEALYDRVSEENRLLRMQLFKAAVRPAWSFEELLPKARKFVTENYLLIMVMFFVLSSVIGGLYTVYRDARASHE